MIGVLGAVGGVGTSSLAAAVASRWGRGTLVDLDRGGGGLDVGLGLERVAGVRWSGLHTSGGRVDPVELARRLPRWRGVGVLAADGADISALAVRSVLAASSTAGPVVVDLGRGDTVAQRAALGEVRVLLVVTVADLRGVAAAHAAARAPAGVRVGVVLRRADMPAAEAAAACGLPVFGRLGTMPRRASGGRLAHGRALRRVADVITSRAPV